MIKKFCDICGEPAIEAPKDQDIPKVYYGERATHYIIAKPMWLSFRSYNESAEQTPDLCKSCMCKLLDNLKSALE